MTTSPTRGTPSPPVLGFCAGFGGSGFLVTVTLTDALAPPPSAAVAVIVHLPGFTAYTATGNPTASGEMPYSGGVASCDFPLGTVLTIEGVGTFIVNDVCPTSGVIDVYMDSYDACINFGVMSANVYVQ